MLLWWAFCCPGVDVATYRSRSYDSPRSRLADVTIGFGIGVPLGVLTWIGTLAWWAHG